jgi:hypothetical protein
VKNENSLLGRTDRKRTSSALPFKRNQTTDSAPVGRGKRKI